VGIATCSLRLADDPTTVNSAGNPVSPLCFAWAGHLGEPAAHHDQERDVASATGAGMAMTADLWHELGGFDESYLAYHEDVDLSLRCWQSGRSVRYVPTAVVAHAYEFYREPSKFFLLERNRLLTVLQVYSGRLLALAAPWLLVGEVAVFAVAVKEGWWRAKLRSWWWLVQHRREIVARRAQVQAGRKRSDLVLARVMSPTLLPGGYARSPGAALLDRPLVAYWRAIALPLLDRGDGGASPGLEEGRP